MYQSPYMQHSAWIAQGRRLIPVIGIPLCTDPLHLCLSYGDQLTHKDAQDEVVGFGPRPHRHGGLRQHQTEEEAERLRGS